MERFEINKEAGLELFINFISSTKEKLASLTDTIKENIKKYENNIESAEAQIADAVSSREKCENEIAKMDSKIESIKEAIENVENTYKKIVEAYSETSKGETKELYSDIIDGAKANCDKDVEKNRSDIARLNSDIEAIKNNIQEFDRQIEEQEKNREIYKQELEKYKKAAEYLEKENAAIISNLEGLNDAKPKAKAPVKKAPTVKETKSEEKKKEEIMETPVEEKPVEIVERPKNETKEDSIVIDDALQRIYDLTGYKKEEPKVEENIYDFPQAPVIEEPHMEIEQPVEEPVYTNNLENLFATPSEDVKAEPVKEDYNDADMFEWESILNGADAMIDNNAPVVPETNISEPINIDTSVKSTIMENADSTVNQMLMPYGTTIEKLKSLVGDSIVYKDGSSIPFVITSEDVIKAINAIDGNDLRAMKTVGPEITLIRLVKKMKEGK